MGMGLFQDISNYKNNADWLAIIPAVFIADMICLFICPNYSSIIKKWYKLFSFQAFAQDVLIILIVFAIVRYLYTYFLKPRFGFNIIIFTLLFLALQIIHDILFSLLVNALPAGKFKMIDYMKEYVSVAKVNAIIGDSILIIGSSIFASLLKNFPNHFNILLIMFSMYMNIYLVNV